MGHKGQIPWNKGKVSVYSKETLVKMKDAHLTLKPMMGKHHSEKTKLKISIAKSGKVSPNRGKKLSIETRQKISNAKKGHTPWNKGKKLPQLSGANSPNWKGGKTSLNRQMKNSIEWKIWREKVFIRDDFTCQKCLKRGIYIEPHHIITVKECLKANDLPRIYDVNNGLTLCRDCHTNTHNWKTKNKIYEGD